MNFKTVIGVVAVAIVLILDGCSNTNCVVEDVTEIGEEKYTCSYEGVKHEFILDLPQTVENAPLVLMLHGYGESAEGFKSMTAFDKDANELGYAVAYVTGAPNPGDSTSARGWNSGIGSSGNNDVDFLKGLSNYLCETYRLDVGRTYAVGFSNGAFMTHRLALEANDTFEAIVSVSGKMPERVWKNRPQEAAISVFLITGQKDDVVPKNSDGSAKYSQDPAIEDVIEYYVSANDLTIIDDATVGKSSELTTYKSNDKVNQVWDLLITDGSHSWPEERYTGININQMILEFLSTGR